MRRLLSILLLAAFTLPLVAPLLALAQDPDAGLPACCRRHGQHHCMMLDAQGDSSRHRVVARCPAWPQRAIPAPVGAHHFAEHASPVALYHRTIFSAPLQLTTRHQVGSEHLHPKRGPPTRLLA